MIDFTGASALKVVNMSLDGNSLATKGLLLIGTAANRVINCIFEKLNVAGCTTYGLEIGESTSKQWDAAQFIEPWLSGNAINVYVQGGNTEQLRFIGGQISSATTYGIEVVEGGVICDSVTFSGNASADVYLTSATQHNQDFLNCYSESSGIFLETNTDVNASLRTINILNCHLLSNKSVTVPGLSAQALSIYHRNNMSINVQGCKGLGLGSDMNKSGSHGVMCVTDIANIWSNDGINPNLTSGNSGVHLLQVNNKRVILNAKKRYIIAQTNNYTVPVELSYCVITNEGVGGGLTFTLPPLEGGLEFTFIRAAAFVIHIDPDSTETIRGGGAGKYLSLDTNGSSVTLLSNGNYWELLSSNGTLSYEP
jgi:hypothetical protein